jgi:hypothetical protein
MSDRPLPRYAVKVLNDGQQDDAILEKAIERDIIEIASGQGFNCDWSTLWNNTYFDCEAIVKFTYQGKI